MCTAYAKTGGQHLAWFVIHWAFRPTLPEAGMAASTCYLCPRGRRGGVHGGWWIHNAQPTLDFVDMHGQFLSWLITLAFAGGLIHISGKLFWFQKANLNNTPSSEGMESSSLWVTAVVQVHGLNKDGYRWKEGCVFVCVCKGMCHMHIHEHKHKSCTIMIFLTNVTVSPFFHGCHLFQKAYLNKCSSKSDTAHFG